MHEQGAATEAKRDTEVNLQVRELTMAIEKLEKSVFALGERLAPVQRSEPPATDSPNKLSVPHVVLCPLGEQLRSLAGSISRVAAIVDSNRNRLEI